MSSFTYCTFNKLGFSLLSSESFHCTLTSGLPALLTLGPLLP